MEWMDAYIFRFGQIVERGWALPSDDVSEERTLELTPNDVTDVNERSVSSVRLKESQDEHEVTADEPAVGEIVSRPAADAPSTSASSSFQLDCDTTDRASISVFPIQMGKMPGLSGIQDSTQIGLPGISHDATFTVFPPDISRISVAADYTQPIVQPGDKKYAQPVDKTSDMNVKPKQCDGQSRSTKLKYFIFTDPNGQKSLVCNFCTKSFTQLEDINKHSSKTHGDTFPFQCNRCGAGFLYETHLMYHEPKCKVKKYQCYLCKASSSNKGSLEYHMRSQHTGERPFSCSICSERFYVKWRVTQHMKRKHGVTN